MNDIFDIIKLYQEDLDSYMIKNDRSIDTNRTPKKIELSPELVAATVSRNQLHLNWRGFTRNLQSIISSSPIKLHKVTEEEGLVIFHAGNTDTGKEIKNIRIETGEWRVPRMPDNFVSTITVPEAHAGDLLELIRNSYQNMFNILKIYLQLKLIKRGAGGGLL